MTKHTNTEQKHRAAPTELTDAELDQVCGGQLESRPLQPGRQPEIITTPQDKVIIPGGQNRRVEIILE